MTPDELRALLSEKEAAAPGEGMTPDELRKLLTDDAGTNESVEDGVNSRRSERLRRRASLPRDKEMWSEHGPGLIRQAAQGLTFGFADEIEALARYATGEDYDQVLDDVRETNAEYAHDNLVASTGAQVAGAIPSFIAGGGLLRGLSAIPGYAGRLAGAAGTAIGETLNPVVQKGVFGGVTAGLKSGAASGALTGVGSGEGGLTNRAVSGAVGAGLGAVGGATLGGAVSAVGNGVRAASTPLNDLATEAASSRGIRYPTRRRGKRGKSYRSELGASQDVDPAALRHLARQAHKSDVSATLDKVLQRKLEGSPTFQRLRLSEDDTEAFIAAYLAGKPPKEIAKSVPGLEQYGSAGERTVARILVDEFDNRGRTFQDLADEVDGELGEIWLRSGDRAFNTAREGPELMRAAFDKRSKQAYERLEGDLRSSTSANRYHELKDELAGQRTKRTAPLYELLDSAPAIHVDELGEGGAALLQNLRGRGQFRDLERDTRRALARAEESATGVNAAKSKYSDPSYFDFALFDAMAKSLSPATSTRGLRGLEYREADSLRAMLDDIYDLAGHAYPEASRARALWREAKQLEEAADAGYEAVASASRASQRAAHEHAKGVRSRKISKLEDQAFKDGAASKLIGTIRNKPEGASLAAQLRSIDGQERISEIFGASGDRFNRAIDAEDAMRVRAQRMTSGSQTGQRLAGDELEKSAAESRTPSALVMRALADIYADARHRRLGGVADAFSRTDDHQAIRVLSQIAKQQQAFGKADASLRQMYHTLGQAGTRAGVGTATEYYYSRPIRRGANR